jgi:hypothetical protein
MLQTTNQFWTTHEYLPKIGNLTVVDNRQKSMDMVCQVDIRTTMRQTMTHATVQSWICFTQTT